MTQRQTFTLAAVHCRDDKRFTDSAEAESATEAVIGMYKKMLEKSPEEDLAVCGVFVGAHSARDLDMPYAFSRPCRPAAPGAPVRDFTVVTLEGVRHVEATDAAAAEVELADAAGLGVAAVFDGHLVDISEQVVWGQVRMEVNAMNRAHS